MRTKMLRPHIGRLLAIVGLTLMSPLVQGATSYDNGLEDRLLASHNRARDALGIAPLEWDNSLALDAEMWGKHLTRVGHLVHSKSDPKDPDPQGENLWAGTRGYYSPEAMVGLWVAEKKNYRHGVFPNVTRTGNLEDVGHYTQVMWRSSKAVGCAVVRGRYDDFLVCRYNEGGNVLGEVAY